MAYTNPLNRQDKEIKIRVSEYEYDRLMIYTAQTCGQLAPICREIIIDHLDAAGIAYSNSQLEAQRNERIGLKRLAEKIRQIERHYIPSHHADVKSA